MTSAEHTSNEKIIARSRGYDAGFRRDSINDHPYEPESILHNEWLDAYKKGKARRNKIDETA